MRRAHPPRSEMIGMGCSWINMYKHIQEFGFCYTEMTGIAWVLAMVASSSSGMKPGKTLIFLVARWPRPEVRSSDFREDLRTHLADSVSRTRAGNDYEYPYHPFIYPCGGFFRNARMTIPHIRSLGQESFHANRPFTYFLSQDIHVKLPGH